MEKEIQTLAEGSPVLVEDRPGIGRARNRPPTTEQVEAIVADPGGRAREIDAIRGWAALSVVCFHVFWETFGVVVPWLRNPYTSGLIAGRFDVILFFILSGDALSHPFFHGGGANYLKRAALKRYLRLTVPILVVTAVTALVMAAGLIFSAQAGDIVERPDWLGTFAQFTPKAATSLRFALYYVYQGDYRANYLPFLWTMPIELFCSLILLLVLFVYPHVRYGVLVVAGLTWVLLSSGSYTGCFLVGMLLGQGRSSRFYAAMPQSFRFYVTPLGIVAALIYVGHCQLTDNTKLLDLTGAGAVALFCIYCNDGLVRFLSKNWFSQFLGRISYLLYLWHFVVLTTFTSYMIIVFADGDRLSPARALTIGVVTVAASLAVAGSTTAIEQWARAANALLLRALWQPEAAGQLQGRLR